MVYEEASRCGGVQGIAVPVPPTSLPEGHSCRVYVKYATNAEATRCKEMMHGRMFDSNQVSCKHVTEVEFNRARMGEWVAEGLDDTGTGGMGLSSMAAQSGGVTIPGLGAIPGLAPSGGPPVPVQRGLPGMAPLSCAF